MERDESAVDLSNKSSDLAIEDQEVKEESASSLASEESAGDKDDGLSHNSSEEPTPKVRQSGLLNQSSERRFN